MRNNAYRENLINTILDNSFSKNWDEAVTEWDIVDCEVDHDCSSRCICGKESIKYLFTIHNRTTSSTLEPIGSKCIKKFGRTDLNSIVHTYEEMDKLYEQITSGMYIELTSEFFSKKLLYELYREGAFEPNKWNRFNAENDYKFLLDMYNSRQEPTPAQANKIKGLIAYQIKPFIRNHLHYSR